MLSLHLLVSFTLAAAPAKFAGVPLGSAELIFQIEAQRLPPEALSGYLLDPDPAVRAAAVRAAGRLGAPAEFFAGPVAGSSVQVRRAAAVALGFSNASAPLIRARLADESDPATRSALLIALGRTGETADVARLLAALPTRQSAAAAEAIGRMGLRKVEGASSDAVVAALLDTLSFPMGETRRNAAWALSRAPLEKLTPAVAERLRKSAETDADPRVRAWLVRAAAPIVSDARFLAAVSLDESSEVRLAAVRAMAKHGCDAAALTERLGDAEVGVRIEAIHTAAQCKGVSVEGLVRILESATPAEQAAALTTLNKRGALPTALAEYQAERWPLPVRIASVEATNEHPKLLRIAQKHADPRLRSAAAGVLLAGTEPPRASDVLELLTADDPVIVQAATDSARENPDPVYERAILTILGKKELSRQVALSAVRALDGLYATGRLPRPSPDANRLIRRWIEAPELSSVAERLAPLLGMENLQTRHPDRVLPSLAEVSHIRSARVFTSRGELRIEFLTEVAPLTVWNFASLAERGYFDGQVFHRVVADFVIQTGDPRGDGWGGPGYEIPDELSSEPYRTGAVGMALSGPDTGGSQWFVTLSPQPHLDYAYTVFGNLTVGMPAAGEIGVGDRIEHVIIERVP